MFRIDKTNIDYIFGKTNAKGHKDRDKKKIIGDLYFSKTVTQKMKIRLKKIWW